MGNVVKKGKKSKSVAQLDGEMDELSLSVAKGLSMTRDMDQMMLVEYSTRDLDEKDAARKLDGEWDELSLSVATGKGRTKYRVMDELSLNVAKVSTRGNIVRVWHS